MRRKPPLIASEAAQIAILARTSPPGAVRKKKVVSVIQLFQFIQLMAHPVERSRRPWSRSSADEMKNAVDPYDADQDEIDRHNIVQQPGHEQNQRPANDGNERQRVMDDGGHPHCEVSPWGLMSDGRADQGRRHDQVGKRRHQAGNEKDDGGRQNDGERQGNDIEAVGRAGHPRHPVEAQPAARPLQSAAPLVVLLKTVRRTRKQRCARYG